MYIRVLMFFRNNRCRLAMCSDNDCNMLSSIKYMDAFGSAVFIYYERKPLSLNGQAIHG
jgi:hypothetical protein